MLSILIPIYNQDVRKLVLTLAKQCNKLEINYQILCFDDGSTEKYRSLNQQLAHTIHVNYTELNENLGRSRIRNWLGKAAYFEYLLFLDGDSKVVSKNFIKTYIENLHPEKVIQGGRIYSKAKPRSKKKMLHWKYGRNRESLTARKRNKHPALNFHSNNFIIPAKVFSQHPFDTTVQGYGYEDTLYAQKLQYAGVDIVHIDNPTIHMGIELNHVFMAKTKQATENLAKLYASSKLKDTRLIKWYEFLNSYELWPSFEWYYRYRQKKIEENLNGDDPSIVNFNLWKLYMFGENLKEKQSK
ncbi:MAG: glycosyltransferase family 2 protein [Lewinellaceae bacterium]|nr:glycosyltransferase family 2 protein [Lewinellaceae bacterium]